MNTFSCNCAKFALNLLPNSCAQPSTHSYRMCTRFTYNQEELIEYTMCQLEVVSITDVIKEISRWPGTHLREGHPTQNATACDMRTNLTCSLLHAITRHAGHSAIRSVVPSGRVSQRNEPQQERIFERVECLSSPSGSSAYSGTTARKRPTLQGRRRCWGD
jgi:hypothetical protein